MVVNSQYTYIYDIERRLYVVVMLICETMKQREILPVLIQVSRKRRGQRKSITQKKTKVLIGSV